ncbi:MAG TPA: agmatine deiminase family protein, partial [Rariglobus sp.]
MSPDPCQSESSVVKKKSSSRSIQPTPAALGFRMPAEWAPQTAIWLSWPHKRASWPGQFRPIPYVFAKIVAQISRFEEVRINIGVPLQKRAWSLITKAGADLSRVTLYDHP